VTLEVWGNTFGVSGTTTSGPAVTTYAQLPVATSVPGQVWQLSDVNNIVVQSLGGIWRPYGGSQVLAMRILNPVTVQSLAEIAAEKLGPFPGGLVRAGMQLRLNWVFANGAIGTGARILRAWAGPVGSIVASGQFGYWQTAANNISVNGEIISRLDVLADASANHIATPTSNSNPLALAGGYQTQTAGVNPLTPLVNFAQAWGIDLRMQSAAETAVNITSASWAAGIATFTTSAAHTLAVGDKTVIADITPTGYNVADGAIVLSVPTTTSFTVAMAADPGAYTSGGTSSRISNMISRSYILTLTG